MSEKPERFYVYSSHKNAPPTFVPAKYLIDAATGEPIKDPNWGKHFFGDNGKRSDVNQSNIYYSLYADVHGSKPFKEQNVNGYYITPEDYNIEDQKTFGKLISGLPKGFKLLDVISYFQPGGAGDLQSTYDGGLYGNGFVRALTDIGAYNYGVVAREAGLSLNNTLYYAGIGNRIRRYMYIPLMHNANPDINTKGIYGDPERNDVSIYQGYFSKFADSAPLSDPLWGIGGVIRERYADRFGELPQLEPWRKIWSDSSILGGASQLPIRFDSSSVHASLTQIDINEFKGLFAPFAATQAVQKDMTITSVMAKLPFDVGGFVMPGLPGPDFARALGGGFVYPATTLAAQSEEWSKINIAGWGHKSAADKAAFAAAFTELGFQPLNGQLSDYIAKGNALGGFVPDLNKLPRRDHAAIPCLALLSGVPFASEAKEASADGSGATPLPMDHILPSYLPLKKRRGMRQGGVGDEGGILFEGIGKRYAGFAGFAGLNRDGANVIGGHVASSLPTLARGSSLPGLYPGIRLPDVDLPPARPPARAPEVEPFRERSEAGSSDKRDRELVQVHTHVHLDGVPIARAVTLHEMSVA